jgi:hypothetical protein
MMMTDCPVCSSPMIATVAAMVSCGASPEEIGLQTDLEPVAVQRHIAECSTVITTDADTFEASDQRLENLQAQINIAATASGLAGDLKSQLAALSLGLRIESEMRRRLEERAEAERENKNDPDVMTIPMLDALVANYAEKVKNAPFCSFCNQPIPGREHANN